VLLLAAAMLARVPVLVAPAAAALGAAYAVTVARDASPDLEAPLAGVALLIVCELGYWVQELRTTAPDEPGAAARHLAWIGVLGVAGFLPGVVLLALPDVLRVEGIAVEAAGALAIAALLAGLLLLARSPGRDKT
jgi:hypothetical protein